MSADTPTWARDALFYEIFPDRFAASGGTPPDWDRLPTRESFSGGDLRGIGERLGYLEELGVTALYLTPIFAAGTNHRYDTHDYLRVDPRLGSEDDLRELVAQAHARGIRVVLDGVFNHVGDGFWAFRDVVLHGAESRYADWFLVDSYPVVAEPPSYQTCGGAPYLPKLNHDNPAVREHLLSVAVHWIETADIDGWRLDVPWKVPLDFWAELRSAVRRAKPDAFLVGEAWWSWGRLLDVFDGLMNYRLRDRLLSFCVSDSMDAEDLRIEIELALADAGDAAMLNLLGSHDTPRLLTLAGGDEQRVRLALSALFALPGAPMLYYGDDVGLEGGDDPDCRRTMPWDDAGRRPAIAEHIRTLAALRRTHPALRDGSFEPLLTRNRLLAFRRASGSDEVVVVLNAGAAQRGVQIPLGGRALAVDVPERDALFLTEEARDA